MKFQRQSVKKIIAFLIFMFLIWEVFIHCTYLFRDTYRAGRQNIIGFYGEEEDSLDVVVIGASCVYRYWDCMYAWKEYGFTSYDYSIGSMSAAATIFAIKDIMKTQEPRVVVFDVRKILSSFPDTEGGIWGALDAQDYNMNRLAAVQYYCRLNGIALKDAWTEIVDIIRYHDNHEALASELSWQLLDNRADESLDKEGFYKGFAIAPDHAFINAPFDTWPEGTADLEPIQETVYIDILEYCRSNDVPLLLVSSPFALTLEDALELNRIEEIAQEYGVPFLNSNKFYEEMGLDFQTDFYDVNHVNLYGADKYTDFLARYMIMNYAPFEDREDSVCASWDSVYERYAAEAEEAKRELRQVISDRRHAFEVEAAMRETEQAHSWLAMADNENITVLVLMYQPCEYVPSLESRSYLMEYGLFTDTELYGSPYMARFCGEVLYGSHTDTEHEGPLENGVTYYLSSDGTPVIKVNETNYFDGPLQGIHMVAFDNNRSEVVDSVVFHVMEDGSLIMEHPGIGGSS